MRVSTQKDTSYPTLFEVIERRRLIETGDRLVVGVSGGADSVFLFHLLLAFQKKKNFHFSVAHLNHGLRKASDQEEDFVRTLSQDHNVPFFSEQGNFSKESPSEEEARDARYHFFVTLCQKIGAQKIALAHTQDDDVETILFRMLRGSGLHGMSGIPYLRDFKGYQVIRPLKEFTHDEIVTILKEGGISWCEDPSNRDPRYTRNRIRHELLPFLEEAFNPNIREILSNFGQNVTEDYEYLKSEGEEAFERVLVKERKDEIVFHRRMFQALSPALQKQLFRLTLQKLGAPMDKVGYPEWKSTSQLFSRKSFRVSLPGALVLEGTPTKMMFRLP